MTVIIIIGIIFFVIYVSSNKKQPVQQKTKFAKPNVIQKTQQEIKDELIQNIIKNVKITVTTSNSVNDYQSDSIIDVTDQAYIINSDTNLIKLDDGVPYWAHHYVYSYSELNSASVEQRKFYNIFKSNFLNGSYLELEGNTNYAFILLFDLLNEYENHKNISKLESLLKTLGQYYPKTKSYGISFLIKKMELDGYTEDVSRLRAEDNTSYQNYNSNYDYDYWRLGSKYKTKLNLNEEEEALLNKLWYPSNNFCSIEYCCIEVLKLYLSLISELKLKYISEGTTIENEFSFVTDVIARKQYRYKGGSQNYKYSIGSITNEFYSIIFKLSENAVREFYGHKRKLNIDFQYTNEEVKIELESRIFSKVTDLINVLVLKVAPPDEATEIELNSQTTSRWKIKFQELTSDYNGKPNEFIESIVALGKLNKKNPSIENIFFEASKFIAKFDKATSLQLYIHYLYHDLKSVTFDNKQLTKTIQKSLFKTNEQLHDFEKIVSELINDKDLKKALKATAKIHEVKRKKIQLDRTTIQEVQQQHSGTVELLNEYLRDDFEDENNEIKSQEINNEEVQIEIIPKNEVIHHTPFLSELSLSSLHISILEIFSKNNFSILQSEIEDYAKSQGVFKNQLIESINENCYDFLDDVLIEEEDDYYTIIPEYFYKISIK